MGIDIKTLEQSQDESQGPNASPVFKGGIESLKAVYGESAPLFADIIRSRVAPEGIYTLGDFGSHRGELLEEILELLRPDYALRTVGFDRLEHLAFNDVVDIKIPSNLTTLRARDNSLDFGFARYVLQWNNLVDQGKIISEFLRVTKDFVIIQHIGPDDEQVDEWRQVSDDLFDGEEVPRLKRGEHFFPSRKEFGSLLKECGVKKAQFLPEERINKGLSNVLISRFSLGEKDAEITRKILGDDMDYITQTTCVISTKDLS